MKPPLYMLALPRAQQEFRCCDDMRGVRVIDRNRAVSPVRWARKLGAAIPASFRVFRRQMATPIAPPIHVGTPVVSSTGRRLGVVRSMVVEVDSGGASYAVSSDAAGVGRVVLFPRHVLRGRDDVAIVDERVARRLTA
jgi:hypothetical protein